MTICILQATEDLWFTFKFSYYVLRRVVKIKSIRTLWIKFDIFNFSKLYFRSGVTSNMRRLLHNNQNDRSKISKIQNIYVDERKGKRMFILAWTLCGVDIRRRGAYCSSTFLSELNHHNTYVYLVIVLNAEKKTHVGV